MKLVWLIGAFVWACSCSSQKSELGKIYLSNYEKDFYQFYPNDTLKFQNQLGKTIEFINVSYKKEMQKFPNSLKESKKHYLVETITSKYQSIPQKYELTAFITPTDFIIGTYPQSFSIIINPINNIYQTTGFYFPNPLNRTCEHQDSLFQCNQSFNINSRLYEGIYKFKTQDFFIQSEEDFLFLFYSKDLGIVRFILKNGEDYHLIH